jgi:hypothetical protein
MQLDADELLAQFRADWPHEYEVSSLRILAQKQAQEIDAQAAEIQRLTALVPTSSYATASTRPFSLSDEDARHG